MRAIAFLLFVILVFLIIRFTLNRVIAIREKQKQQDEQSKNQKTGQQKHEEMVRCAECGVHLPQAQAYFDGQDTFCSEGHMQQYRKKKVHSSAYDQDD